MHFWKKKDDQKQSIEHKRSVDDEHVYPLKVGRIGPPTIATCNEGRRAH